jgi:CubicO group peptidase (beta-lactamase class C family)
MTRRLLLGHACAAAALASTATPAVSAGATDPPPPAVSAITVPPGQIDAAVGRLDTIATQMLAQTGVPGMAIAVVHDDQVVYAKGFGVRDVRTGKAVDANTVFELASLSKPVGATVVARSVSRHAVAWDEPVSRLLPHFRLKRASTTSGVTIADLYSHRSGLPDHAGDLLEDLGYDQAQVLHRLRYEPLTPIRSHYAYTNFGLTAAAEAVARAEHTSWAKLSQANLYGPLGMTSTSSRYADYAHAPNRAALHVDVDGKWEAKYVRNADAQSPAGGVSSSVNDMAKWMRLQLGDGRFAGRRLISRTALDQMRTPFMLSNPPATPTSRSGFYGLGLNIGNDSAGRVRWSHSGAFGLGAGTTFTMLPSEHLGIVVLTNGQPFGMPEAIAATFMDLAELGRVERDWLPAYRAVFAPLLENDSVLAGRTRPAHPKRARAAAAYTGTYPNRYYGAARVTARGQRLTLVLGPKGKRFPLTHWNGDRFSYVPTGENAEGPSEVRFSLGRDGRARSLRVENLDESGLGTFTR